MPKPATDLVQTYYRTVDDDPGAVPSLFSLEAVYERPGYEPLVGRSSIARFYDGRRVIQAGGHWIEEVIHQDDRVAVRGHFKGRSHSGEPLDARFSDFFEFEDGLISRRTTYFFVAKI
ncbi:nuclear transport factor 2 family protein [Rathayibacter tritici]|uniref:SnoaL-like domain-containing protein n=2 Tax=Rathayibacter tritici TaxID=33888 RepID=A0A160KPG5_9MICO|nr:nuclear transport factor 2 family protein [Rathayibacter tritici]AND15272.1 hypothetical protein A6122_0105 [Rathayibacter tritici]PPI47711.1 ketosteroid isomerase [Rathayibacter tritici]